MGGLSVPGRGFLVAVYLDQNKARWVILLLDKIEARDPRFLYAVSSVLQSERLEIVDEFRHNLRIDKHDKHSTLLYASASCELHLNNP
jgi:hypothetical protein